VKVQFDQICALVVFGVCAVLIVFKVDSEVKSAMTLAVGFLFGSGYQQRRLAKGGK
jgi:hypothetical protein